MNKKDWQKIARALGLLTLLGISIIVNIGIGFWLGKLLDTWTGQKVLFKIIGIIIGVISGFYSDYRLINDVMGDNKNVDR